MKSTLAPRIVTTLSPARNEGAGRRNAEPVAASSMAEYENRAHRGKGFVMWHHKPRPDSLGNAFITGVDQVCTVVSDFDDTIAALTEKLGIGPFKCWTLQAPALFNQQFRGAGPDAKSEWTMRLGVALVGRTQWEVIQPLAGPSVFTEHLAQRGPGLHHILVETAGTSYRDSLQRLDSAGFAQLQSAMVNLPLQVGALTVPAVPERLAAPLSTHFAYVDTPGALGTTLELAQFPPGISRPLGVRIGKADFFAPPDATRVTDDLPNSFIDRVEKLGFIVRELGATVRAWADRAGVGPWHIVNIDSRSIGEIKIGGASVDVRARVAWAMAGGTLIEVIQPLGDDTPHAHLLAQKGDGLHYVGVRSDTLSTDDAVARFKAVGCAPLLQGVLFGGYEFALIDASALAGTWFEILSLDAEPLYQQLCRLQPAERYPT
jgi:hypothetical protein